MCPPQPWWTKLLQKGGSLGPWISFWKLLSLPQGRIAPWEMDGERGAIFVAFVALHEHLDNSYHGAAVFFFHTYRFQKGCSPLCLTDLQKRLRGECLRFQFAQTARAKKKNTFVYYLSSFCGMCAVKLQVFA